MSDSKQHEKMKEKYRKELAEIKSKIKAIKKPLALDKNSIGIPRISEEIGGTKFKKTKILDGIKLTSGNFKDILVNNEELAKAEAEYALKRAEYDEYLNRAYNERRRERYKEKKLNEIMRKQVDEQEIKNQNSPSERERRKQEQTTKDGTRYIIVELGGKRQKIYEGEDAQTWGFGDDFESIWAQQVNNNQSNSKVESEEAVKVQEIKEEQEDKDYRNNPDSLFYENDYDEPAWFNDTEPEINTAFEFYIDEETGEVFSFDDSRIYEKDKSGHLKVDEHGKLKIKDNLKHKVEVPMSKEEYEDLMWQQMNSKFENLAEEASPLGDFIKEHLSDWRDNYSVSDVRSAFEQAAADGYELSWADLYEGDLSRLALKLAVIEKYLPGYSETDLLGAVMDLAEYDEMQENYEMPE